MYIALSYYRAFLLLLHKHHVRYLLVGGAAVHSYGYERGTNDVDLWVDHDPTNMIKLMIAIREFGYDTKNIENRLFTENDPPIKLTDGENKIDILHHLTKVLTFQEAYANATLRDNGDFQFYLIDYYHLEKIKLATNREKDWIDVVEMRKIREIETGEKAKSVIWPRIKSLLLHLFKK